MFRSWINLMMLAAESQQVMLLRTLKLAKGGQSASTEARLMVTEKVMLAGIEGTRLARGATTSSVISNYRKKVRANLRRLK